MESDPYPRFRFLKILESDTRPSILKIGDVLIVSMRRPPEAPAQFKDDLLQLINYTKPRDLILDWTGNDDLLQLINYTKPRDLILDCTDEDPGDSALEALKNDIISMADLMGVGVSFAGPRHGELVSFTRRRRGDEEDISMPVPIVRPPGGNKGGSALLPPTVRRRRDDEEGSALPPPIVRRRGDRR